MLLYNLFSLLLVLQNGANDPRSGQEIEGNPNNPGPVGNEAPIDDYLWIFALIAIAFIVYKVRQDYLKAKVA